MAGQSVHQQKLQPSQQPAQRDDSKIIVSEILKRIDPLIRKGDLIRAQLEINNAKEVDPHNAYIFALEERISLLKTKIANTTEVEQQKKEPVLSLESKLSPAPESAHRQVPVAHMPKLILDDSTPSRPQTPPAVRSENVPQGKERDSVTDRSLELESYRKALRESWSDGALSEGEERYLKELRTLLDISEADCSQVEKSVKYESYRKALIHHLAHQPSDISITTTVTDLQSCFQITDDEHIYILTQLTNITQRNQRDKVLVIDDDTRLLDLLAASLEDNGFEVIALSTSDEAYTLLRKFIPDLILCDINLETSSMGGFTFYEKIQGFKNIQTVPFIFLTGLSDESLVHAGKELGVDDYLMKPISEAMLVATLRGKLKRYKQLNKIFSAPMPAMAAA